MFDILHASRDGDLYTAAVSRLAEVEDLVGVRHVEALSSTESHLVFWFNPGLDPMIRPVNFLATELLLATTRFTARSVPLLRGDVVLTRHDGGGNLAGLTQGQLDWLIDSHPSYREELVLSRRFARDRRHRRRAGSMVRAL